VSIWVDDYFPWNEINDYWAFASTKENEIWV
jgi:hypothetical protein